MPADLHTQLSKMPCLGELLGSKRYMSQYMNEKP